MQLLLILFTYAAIIPLNADVENGNTKIKFKNEIAKSGNLESLYNFLQFKNVIQSSSEKDKQTNWVSKWVSNFMNMATEDQRNFITKHTKTLTSKLGSIVDRIPLSAQLLFLQYVKFMCKKGLPKPFGFIISLSINRFTKKLTTRNRKLKQKNALEPFLIKQKDFLNEKLQEIIDESAKRLEKSYIIAMHSIINAYVYVEYCGKNYEKSNDIIEYISEEIRNLHVTEQNEKLPLSEEIQNHGVLKEINVL